MPTLALPRILAAPKEGGRMRGRREEREKKEEEGIDGACRQGPPFYATWLCP